MTDGRPTRSASWSSETGRWPAKPNTSATRLSLGLRVLNGSSGCSETEPAFCSRCKCSFAFRLGAIQRSHAYDISANRRALHQHHPDAVDRRSPESEFGTSGDAVGRGAGGVRLVD